MTRQSWTACAVVLLAACFPRPTTLPPDEQLAVTATLDGWRAAGLPDPGDCLDGATVVWASSQDDFERRCADGLGVGVPYLHDAFEQHKPAACLAWRKVQTGLRVRSAPVAVLRPGQALYDLTGGPASHELLHALVGCTLGRPAADRFDSWHRDPRVWIEAGKDESAQGRARTHLREHGKVPS